MQKKLKKSSSGKQSNFKKLIEQIQKIPADIREACLRRYLAACKYKNALAFFQWRNRQ